MTLYCKLCNNEEIKDLEEHYRSVHEDYYSPDNYLQMFVHMEINIE